MAKNIIVFSGLALVLAPIATGLSLAFGPVCLDAVAMARPAKGSSGPPTTRLHSGETVATAGAVEDYDPGNVGGPGQTKGAGTRHKPPTEGVEPRPINRRTGKPRFAIVIPVDPLDPYGIPAGSQVG